MRRDTESQKVSDCQRVQQSWPTSELVVDAVKVFAKYADQTTQRLGGTIVRQNIPTR